MPFLPMRASTQGSVSGRFGNRRQVANTEIAIAGVTPLFAPFIDRFIQTDLGCVHSDRLPILLDWGLLEPKTRRRVDGFTPLHALNG